MGPCLIAMKCGAGPKPIVTHVTVPVTSLSSLGSGVEAFSHYPCRGSFEALSVQTTSLPITTTHGSSRTECEYYSDILSSVG